MAEEIEDVVEKYSESIYRSINQYGEIPDWLTMYPKKSTIGFQQYIDAVSFPTDVYSPWFNSKRAFWDQARLVQRSLGYNRSVNIIELFQTQGDTCLPLLLEFLWAKQLTSYTSMMATPHLNKLTSDTLKRVLSQFTQESIEFNSLATNPEFDSFVPNVKKHLKKHQKQDSINVYVLATSVMSNFLDNNGVLNRIRSVMQDEDYLLISQDMFRDGGQEDLVKQYSQFYKDPNSTPTTRRLTKMIEPDYEFHLEWQEHAHYRGPTLYFNIERSTGSSFVYADLKPKQQVTVFRSHRFTIPEIVTLFEKNGLRIESMFMEEKQDNAVFLVRKSRTM